MKGASHPSLDRLIGAVQFRLTVARTAPDALRVIMLLSLVAAASAPVVRWLLRTDPWWLVLVPAAGGGASILAALKRRPDARRAASEIDASHGFHDACGTVVGGSGTVGADPVFAALHRESLEALLPRVDLRRLGSPMPGRARIGGCAIALLMLGASLWIQWPALPAQKEMGPSTGDGITDGTIAPGDPTLANEPRRVAELAERVEELAASGRLGEAERVLDELEQHARSLEQSLQQPPGESLPPAARSEVRRALIESASRVGEAAEAVRRTPDPSTDDPAGTEPGADRRRPEAPARTAEDSKHRSSLEKGDAHRSEQGSNDPGPERSRAEGAGNESASRFDELRRDAPGAGEAAPRPDSDSRRGVDGAAATTTPDARREGGPASGAESTRPRSGGGGAQRSSEAPAQADGGTPNTGMQGRRDAGAGPPDERRDGAPSDGSRVPDASASEPRAAEQGAPGARPTSASPSEGSAPGHRPGDSGTIDREQLERRLDDLSRRLGGSAMPEPETGPRSSERPPSAPSTRPSTDPRFDGGPSGRSDEPGLGAGDGRASANAPAGTSVIGRRLQDIEAMPPDPDHPGTIVDRVRDRDPSAPLSANAGGAVPGGARRARTDPANDPAVAPRFRPLVSRYFERVRPASPAPEDAARPPSRP